MKNSRLFFVTFVIAFAASLALLYLDRQGTMIYENDGGISSYLQLFIENILDLH